MFSFTFRPEARAAAVPQTQNVSAHGWRNHIVAAWSENASFFVAVAIGVVVYQCLTCPASRAFVARLQRRVVS